MVDPLGIIHFGAVRKRLEEHSRLELGQRVERITRCAIACSLVKGKIASRTKFGLECLFRHLLIVEVDRELHVETCYWLYSLVGELTHDAARGVDFVDPLAPTTVQFAFEAELDTELANAFVALVALGQVGVETFLGDGPHVTDHVRGQRRVEVYALVLDHDIDARVVLTALLDEGNRVFIHVFLQRQWQQSVVQLPLRARFWNQMAGVVATHEVIDWCFQGARESFEQLLTILLLLDDSPVHRHGEDALVISQHPTIGIKDATTFRRRVHNGGFRGGHSRLVDLALDTLKEPQPGTQEPDEDERHGGKDAESGGALVNSHWNILV